MAGRNSRRVRVPVWLLVRKVKVEGELARHRCAVRRWIGLLCEELGGEAGGVEGRGRDLGPLLEEGVLVDLRAALLRLLVGARSPRPQESRLEDGGGSRESPEPSLRLRAREA